MPRTVPLSVVAALSLGLTAGLQGQQPAPAPDHPAFALADMRWTPIGPGLEWTVLEGDPMVAGQPYTAAVRLTSGSWIKPHWHPNPKRIVVLAGTMLMGMGEVFDTASGSTRRFPVGSFVLMPGKAVHYEGGEGTTVLLFTGTGPLATTFVPERTGS